MADLLASFDMKTILLVMALGGSNMGQYFGLSMPAKADTSSAVELVSEAQSDTLECLHRVADLQEMLADCQEECME